MVSADVQLLVLFTHQFFNLNREHGKKLVEATAVFVSEHLWPQCDSVSCRPELNVLTFNSVAEPKILFKALSCVVVYSQQTESDAGGQCGDAGLHHWQHSYYLV